MAGWTDSEERLDYASLVHQACIYDRYELLADLLLNKGQVDVNCFDTVGRTALSTCVSNDSIDCCQLLLANGADINLRNRRTGQTALHQATEERKPDFVTLLIQFGADVLLRDGEGRAPLDYFTDETSRSLLLMAADTQRAEKEGARQALMSCLLEPTTCDIALCAEYAICLGRERTSAVINSASADEDSFLFKACMVRRKDLVDFLINHGASAHFHKGTCETVLHEACSATDIDIAEVILKKFPELVRVRTVNEMGSRLPIHVACVKGSLELVKLLLEFHYPEDITEEFKTADDKYIYRAPFDLNDADFGRRTPIFNAVMSMAPELVQYLLDFKVAGYPVCEEDGDVSEMQIAPVDVNCLAFDNLTPLCVAVQCGSIEITRLLLEHGANVNQRFLITPSGCSDARPASACLIAVERGDYAITELLLAYGVHDDDKAIVRACYAHDNDRLLRLLLLQRVCEDAERRAIVIRESDEEPYTALRAVSVNWDDVLLHEVQSRWLIDCGLRLNRTLSPDHQPAALAAITVLDISRNFLVDLPDCVLRMRSVNVLNISGNALEVLPSVAGMWPELQELLLAGNKIASVPESFFQLPALERLDLARNQLEQVPCTMWFAPKLRELDLSNNRLKSLPVGVDGCQSTDLQEGDPAAFVGLTVCAMDTGYESNSTDTDTTSSSVAGFVMVSGSESLPTPELPDTTAPLQIDVYSRRPYVKIFDNEGASASSAQHHLRELKLSCNRFLAIPSGLPCLAPKLDKLDLSGNKLTNLGHPTVYPPELTSLILSNNEISNQELHRCLSDAQIFGGAGGSLRRSDSPLIVPSNPPPSRSQGLRLSMASPRSSDIGLDVRCKHYHSSQFEQLKHLDLANNKLSKFEFVSCKSTTDSVTRHDDAHEVLFPVLTHLDLSGNRLAALGEDVSRLSGLAQLILSGNPIKDLPAEMGSLSQLWNLELRDCPLEGPLASMVEGSARTVDIIGFLKSILQEAKPFTSMKLMFVGVSNIGKTTLLNELKKESGNSIRNNPFGKELSTVGVDISSLVVKKHRGEVTFRTWDFGGQEEYYATHQYFLTKRSLYLVLWKVSDGAKAVDGIRQWLVNIQTRAPDSPVIIVGTHLDKAACKTDVERMQAMIDSQFIHGSESEKKGLPNVRGRVEINCNNSSDVRKVLNIVYETAWSLLAPGSRTTKLLEQRIPAVYMQLADVVTCLAKKLRDSKMDPVLTTEEYRKAVEEHMASTHQQFRDLDELQQATQFLHDNGVILHFNDVTLRNLYFLDPEWLSHILAKVIAVKEANPFAKNGLMNVADIRLVYPAAANQETLSWFVDLLSKFELALLLQNNILLIPSLLPKECPVTACLTKIQPLHRLETSKSTLGPQRQFSVRGKILGGVNVTGDGSCLPTSPDHAVPVSVNTTATSDQPGLSTLTRLYFLAFIPSGFWSRLLLHIISDKAFTVLASMVLSLQDFRTVAVGESKVLRISGCSATTDSNRRSSRSNSVSCSIHWQCWDTGLRLVVMDATILEVRQASSTAPCEHAHHPRLTYSAIAVNLVSAADKPARRLQSGFATSNWVSEDTGAMASSDSQSSGPWHIIELSVPANNNFALQHLPAAMHQPVQELRGKLLSRALYHIEALLEDWYPSLGLRFSQNLCGTYLVNRFVPCPKCIEDIYIVYHACTKQDSSPESSMDTNDGSTVPSTEFSKLQLFGYLLDEAILCSCTGKVLKCLDPHHGAMPLTECAPDVIFNDIGELHLSADDVMWGAPFAKGAFGIVYKGQLKHAFRQTEVAIKTYEPVDKGMDQGVSDSLLHQYHAAARHWQQSPMQYATDAYFNARSEIDVMLSLSHPGVVSLVGIIVHPLAMVLPLAPLGSMRSLLDAYRREGRHLAASIIKRIVVQVADALAYLHKEKIIYRDLKADNVLAWSVPLPSQCSRPTAAKVDVKLADYGISRQGTDGGTKGFAGTPGYMAPEIIEHGGSERYSEKVDCFSFGMFLYELLSLKRPFEDADPQVNKEIILKGLRPKISLKETAYPSHFLDLLALCWHHTPKARPSAQEIVDIAVTPQFDHLVQAVQSRYQFYTTCALALPQSTSTTMVTIGSSASGHVTDDRTSSAKSAMSDTTAHRALLFGASFHADDRKWIAKTTCFLFQNGHCIAEQPLAFNDEAAPVICCLLADKHIWLADDVGCVRVYELPFSLDGATSTVADRQVASFAACEPSSGTSVIGLHHRATTKDVVVVTSDGTVSIRQNHCGGEAGVACLAMERERHKASLSDITCSQLLGERRLWLGRRWAAVEVFCMTSCSTLRILSHGPSFEEEAATSLLVTDVKELCVWSAVYPGSYVYRWETDSYRLNSVDISAAISSQTHRRGILIQSVTVNDQHSSTHHIRALKVVTDSQLIVATSLGCILVLDALTLTFITSLTPFDSRSYILRDIVALPMDHTSTSGHYILNGKEHIVTFGHHYKSMLGQRDESTQEGSSHRDENALCLLSWAVGVWQDL